MVNLWVSFILLILCLCNHYKGNGGIVFSGSCWSICMYVFVKTIFCKPLGEFLTNLRFRCTWRQRRADLILKSKGQCMTRASMVRSVLFGPFCHHTTLNDASLKWNGCVVGTVLAKWDEWVKVTTTPNMTKKVDAYASMAPNWVLSSWLRQNSIKCISCWIVQTNLTVW